MLWYKRMRVRTLYKTLPSLESNGVIIETRKIGKANLFRLNGDSEVVKDNGACGQELRGNPGQYGEPGE